MTLHLRNGVLRGISNLSSNTSRTLAKTPCHSRFASIISTKRAAAATISVTRHFSTTQIGRTESSDFEFDSSAVELYSSGKNAVREISEQTLEDSLKDDDYFDLKGLVSMQELFDAGVHYGHKKGMGYETMTEYLLGHRFDNCIIDLNHTAPLLEDALNFVAHIAFRGGIILFVSNHRETAHMVEATAMECGEYAHTKEWLTAVFCDSTSYFGEVTRLPDLVIVMSTKTTVFDDHLAIRDSAKMLIPTIGICDSNADPRMITYPIPGNDDSVSAISLYLRLFKTAIQRGKMRRAATLLREEQENSVDAVPMNVSGQEEELSTKERNERLIDQITALQEATKRNAERVQLEKEAQLRESEFAQEEAEEKEKLTKEIQEKKKRARKKKKMMEKS